MKNLIVVHKYGGTSLKDPELLYNCAENIHKDYKSGRRPVVVVSAMGRRGDPYATDTFLDLAGKISSRPASRELDLLMACGELISATLLAVQLQELGCPAMALTGSQAGIITNKHFGLAEILAVETKRIRQVVESGTVPVICGFQGVTEAGEITTLGRGGSDITAVAVAAALKLESAIIYTDVPAVKTADPKLVKNALPIYGLNYQEILEMAVEGARVIHPRAVERAMADDVRLIITSLANGNKPPTEIGPRCGIPRDGDTIRAVTHLNGITQFQISIEPEGFSALLEEITENGISLDLISVSEKRHSFSVLEKYADLVEAILQNSSIQVTRRNNCSKISLIGVGIRGIPGVMAKIYRPLTEKKIPIYHTSDSYTQIAILVPEEHLDEAINCLHQVFFGEE
jgi:aspartate kinase